MRKQILSACTLAIFLMAMPSVYASCPCKAGYHEVQKTSTFSWNIFKGFKKCEPCTKTKCVKDKCPKQAKCKCKQERPKCGCKEAKPKCGCKKPACPQEPKCTGAAAPAPVVEQAPCNDCTRAF